MLTDGTRVTGVRTSARDAGSPRSAGEEIPANVVLAANGRRSEFPRWVRDAGMGEIEEVVEDTGIVYWSRFDRLRDGAEPLLADLGLAVA